MAKSTQLAPVRFAAEFLIVLGLGAVAAFLVTYVAGALSVSLKLVSAEEWPTVGDFISGITFGVIVGYRLAVLNRATKK